MGLPPAQGNSSENSAMSRPVCLGCIFTLHCPAVQEAADLLLEICNPSLKPPDRNRICRPSMVLHNMLQVYHLLVESLVAATGTGILLCRVRPFVLIIPLAPIIVAAAAGLRLSFSAYRLHARSYLCPGWMSASCVLLSNTTQTPCPQWV